MNYPYKDICLERILDECHGDEFYMWFPLEKYEERFYRFNKDRKYTSYVKIVGANNELCLEQVNWLFDMEDMFPLKIIIRQDYYGMPYIKE